MKNPQNNIDGKFLINRLSQAGMGYEMGIVRELFERVEKLEMENFLYALALINNESYSYCPNCSASDSFSVSIVDGSVAWHCDECDSDLE